MTDDHEDLLLDKLIYGTSVTLGGERVDPKIIYMPRESTTEELLGGFIPVSEYEHVNLLDCELGHVDSGFRFIHTDARRYRRQIEQQQIVHGHGPQRKGRGGKIKKW